MERRNFLKRTVAGMGTLAGLQFTRETINGATDAQEGLSLTADHYQAPDWLRYARTVYFDGYSPPVYPHMKEFDARRLVEIVTELGGDTLRFQPIGYWACFPSKVFRVHPELGSRDLIDEVARECRRVGVHHYCYTGIGHPHMEIGWVDQHPKYADWVLRGPDGKPYGHWWHIGWGLRQYICVTGDAFREAIREIVKELCEHDIDGVYFDAPSGYRGICFCDSCRRNFKKFSGMDIEKLSVFVQYGENVRPIGDDRASSDAEREGLIKWYEWANQLANEDLLDFRKIIHGRGKFMLCHNGLTWRGTSLPLQYRIPNGFMMETIVQVHQRLRVGLMGASMARPYKKLAQMYMGSYSTGFKPPHGQPMVVHNTNLEDTDEIRMDGLTNLACGNAPIYATANRLYYRIGSGSAAPAREIFALMRRMEPLFKDSVPVPYVTIVPTWESLQLWRTRRSSWNEMMSDGFGLAMLDAMVSFDVSPSTEMSEAWLAEQRVIVLCGASGVSDTDAERLAAWVERGGGLLATYDTGLYDERGQLRQDGGALRRVLGVEMKGEPLDSQPECYYRMQQAHPALGEYGKGTIVQGDGRVVPVEVRGGATILADCWNLGTNESRGPAITVHTYGKGRSIYISGSLEAQYITSRVVSIRRLLASMVSFLGGGKPFPFALSAPRGVYGVLRRATNGDLMLWVLANVGFKDEAIGIMRQEFMSVPNVEVNIRVPEGRRPKSVELVRAGRDVPFRHTNGNIVVTIPMLHIAEIVHLEFEQA